MKILHLGDGYKQRVELLPQVKALQEQLRQEAFDVKADGQFGPDTERALRIWQAEAGLQVTGTLDEDTWGKMLQFQVLDGSGTEQQRYPQTLQGCLAYAAALYVGQRERPGNAGFVDPTFERMMREVGWKPGDPWCSYYGELAWLDGYRTYLKSRSTAAMPELQLLGLTTPAGWLLMLHDIFHGSAYQTWENFKAAPHFEMDIEPVRGAIAVLKSRLSWKGHLYIVYDIYDDYVVTIEGNSNSAGGREGIEVAKRRRPRHKRSFGTMKLLGYIYPLDPTKRPSSRQTIKRGWA